MIRNKCYTWNFLLFQNSIKNFSLTVKNPQVSVCFFFFYYYFQGVGTKDFFNPLPNNKILDLSKFKQFADNKLVPTQKLKFVLGREENIVGKGENAGYQHFLLFQQRFRKACFSGSLKVGIVW